MTVATCATISVGCGTVWHSPSAASRADTLTHTVLANGHRYGERRSWQVPDGGWRYEYSGSALFGEFPRIETLWLDDEGFPVRLTIDGQRTVHDRWEERFRMDDATVHWSAGAVGGPGESWTRLLDADSVGRTERSAFYTAVHPVHDLGVLARALLGRADSSAALLPQGTAHLEPIERTVFRASGDSLAARLFALHGLGFRPRYVWLTEGGETFADEFSIRSGWEDAFPAIRAAIDGHLADYHAALAAEVVAPERRRPLVIHDTRLFESTTGRVLPGATVIVTGNRVSAVGWDGEVDVPRGADSLDAGGRTLLPGLWDLHVHSGITERAMELAMPLHLAAGVTTVRDMGTDPAVIASLRDRIAAGDAVGPRVLPSGWIDGARPVAPLVETPAQARAAVDRYAASGFGYIKVRDHASRDVVAATVERAWSRRVRVGGHVPTGLTAEDVVVAGYKEVSHLAELLWLIAEDEGSALVDLDADAPAVRALIDLLVTNHVALDPTLAVYDAMRVPPAPWVTDVADRYPAVLRRHVIDDLGPFDTVRQPDPRWGEIVDHMVGLVGAFHDAGGQILPGSDLGLPGDGLRRELELLVEAGISPRDVLSLATIGAARAMELHTESGSVEPGKLADMALIDGDPIRDITQLSRVHTVIKDGRVYDPDRLLGALGVRPPE